MKNAGIYIIYCCSYPGKYYIGSAIKFYDRWKKHKSDLQNNIHSCKYLQRIFNKYGKDSFKFYIIEYVKDLSQILNREDYYLQDWFEFESELYNGYFIAGSPLGYNLPKIQRRKISLSLIGNKRALGKKHKLSNITKKKMSLWQLGRKLPKETKQKLRRINLGKHHTKKTCLKMSLSRTGSKNAFYGKHHSKETKRKISLNNMGNKYRFGKKHSEESKIKMSESAKRRCRLLKKTSLIN